MIVFTIIGVIIVVVFIGSFLLGMAGIPVYQNKRLLYEDKYIKAFVEMNNNHFNEKEWLVNNFKIYKLTLNWPPNLPPINRSNLIKGTLKEKFNSTYKELLCEYEYELNNDDQSLIIKDKHFWL